MTQFDFKCLVDQDRHFLINVYNPLFSNDETTNDYLVRSQEEMIEMGLTFNSDFQLVNTPGFKELPYYQF